MRSKSFILLFLLILLVSLGSCTNGNKIPAGESAAPSSNSLVVRFAYSPEKKQWLEERFKVFNAEKAQVNGQTIFVEGVEKSSGAARTEIKNGTLSVTAWSPSASTWLEVLKCELNKADLATSAKPLVLTPVVISLWKPMAEALGWPKKPIGWQDMLELINDPQGWGKFGHPEWGKFSWGHTDPEISTTALSTLIAEFYAVNNKQRGLSVEDVRSPTSQQFIRDLGKGIKHYGYNTLVFSENMQKFGMSYISAFPMEEITLIEFNKANPPPPTPLVAIYPKEGTFWHDNPFVILASASEVEQEAASKFYEFLLTEESQKLALSYGFRPANVNVTLTDPVSAKFGVQPEGIQNTLDVPKAEVIVAAKDSWALNRKRADILLVVDISGSMAGEKLEAVKAGLDNFLQRILPEDRVGLIVFSDTAELLVKPAPLSESRIALQTAIQGLQAKNKTAVFDALEIAHQELNTMQSAGVDRIRGIVLLSDGADNSSKLTLAGLEKNFFESGVSIFPVAYGEDADLIILKQIANFSRTIIVQGNTKDIQQIFDNLSRYF